MELEYPSLSPEQIAEIANMEINFHALLPELNRQKKDMSFAEWNQYRIATGQGALNSDYLRSMYGRERAIWNRVDIMAREFIAREWIARESMDLITREFITMMSLR